MATTSLITQVTGQAWVRGTDGSLIPLRAGMRVQAEAEIVTADGAQVALQADGLPAVTIGGNREVQLNADMAEASADPFVSAAAVPTADDAARVLAALQAGEDPFATLDPTAAVLAGAGGDDGGSSFTRIAAILETTTPLGLEYPRPTLAGIENIVLGSGAAAEGDAAAAPLAIAPTLTLVINEDNSITFQFSQVPVGFDLDDITGFNGTISNLVQDPNDPTRWTAELQPNEGFEGEIVVSVPDGSYTNEDGVPGTGGSGNTNVQLPQPEEPGTEEPGTEEPGTEEPGTEEPGTEEPGTEEPGTEEPGTEEPGDETRPTVVVTINDDGTVTFQFSEEPFGFDEGDVFVENGNISNLTQDPGDPTRWTADLEPSDDFEGEVTVSVPDNSYTDEAGNPGFGGADSTTVDTLAPTVVVTINDDGTVTFQFSEEPFGFDEGDVFVENGNISNLTPVPGDPTRWTADLEPSDDFEGEVTVTVPDNSYTDEAGNPGAGDNDSVIVDTLAPEAEITIDPITADNVINAAEADEDVTVTGTVGADVKVGDTVTVTVGGFTETTTVLEGNIWTLDVPGSVLAENS
ncbi:MAG: retention module-containing protein, partial [Burkholderiaceae bacterium]